MNKNEHNEILKIFKKEAIEHVNEISKIIKDYSNSKIDKETFLKNLYFHTHALKGSAGILKATKLFEFLDPFNSFTKNLLEKSNQIDTICLEEILSATKILSEMILIFTEKSDKKYPDFQNFLNLFKTYEI